jgi:hypothetical protein
MFKSLRWLSLVLLVLLVAAGCSPAQPTAEATEVVTVETIVEGETVIEEVVVTATSGAPLVTEEAIEEASDAGQPLATPAPTHAAAQGSGNVLPSTYQVNRLIVKDANVSLMVEETDIALDRLTQIIGDSGGYIISSRIWYEDWLDESYKYADINLAVPVDRFEMTMRRLRDLSVKVLNETASGQDVTDEYVDLESRLRNLEATRDRIREFLEQAEDVEEALKVNAELSAVDGQIEQVQGRMNYLYDRASYSTITVRLSPQLPDVPPPPPPTPTPTPTPTPRWDPEETVDAAQETALNMGRGLVEVAIWFAFVVLPFLLPAAGIYFVARRLRGAGMRDEDE